MKTLIIGNTGSGKSAMARHLIGIRDIPWLSLDEIAWSAGKAGLLEGSLRELKQFIEQHDQWVIEGCHGDLVEAVIPHCTELRFLNPGVEECINRCLNKLRRFKRALEEGEETLLDRIVARIGKYDYRDDGYGRQRHQDLFDSFSGPKKVYTAVIY